MTLKITPFFNESHLLPFHLKYYDWVEVDIYFDFGSTDSSAAIIREHQKKTGRDIRIINCDTKEYREDVLMLIRNHYYKYGANTGFDYTIIADVDEFIYSKNLTAKLAEKRFDAYYCKCLDIISEEEIDDRPIIEQVKLGQFNDKYSKISIFDPKIDIRYDWGCHGANPVWLNGNGAINICEEDFYILHLRFFGKKFFLNNNKSKHARIKDYGRTHNVGDHYLNEEQELHSFFNTQLQNSHNILFK